MARIIGHIVAVLLVALVVFLMVENKKIKKENEELKNKIETITKDLM